MTGPDRKNATGRLVLALVVLAVLIVPGRLLAVEHEGDDELVPFAGGGTGSRGHAAPGTTWNADAGVVAADRDLLRVVEVRPRVTTDTSAADITVRLCVPRPHGGVGVTTGPLTESCSAVADPDGARVRLRPGVAQLVVSVTPHHAGVVRIDGYDVTYVDNGHRGTEYAGTTIRLRVA